MPFRAPENDIEAALVAIWTDVLRQDGIGIDDPFLDLGGDSLQAMQIVARAIGHFALDLSLADVLKESTIAAMARTIAAQRAGDAPPIGT